MSDTASEDETAGTRRRWWPGSSATRGIANAEVRVGDAEALDVSAAWVDAVLTGFMICFCPDPDRLLAEFARALKPGGVVALTIFEGTTPSQPRSGQVPQKVWKSSPNALGAGRA